jgi:hypothetical protein
VLFLFRGKNEAVCFDHSLGLFLALDFSVFIDRKKIVLLIITIGMSAEILQELA